MPGGYSCDTQPIYRPAETLSVPKLVIGAKALEFANDVERQAFAMARCGATDRPESEVDRVFGRFAARVNATAERYGWPLWVEARTCEVRFRGPLEDDEVRPAVEALAIAGTLTEIDWGRRDI